MSSETISITQALLNAGYTEDEIIENALKVVAIAVPSRYAPDANEAHTVYIQAQTDDIIGFDISVKPIKG